MIQSFIRCFYLTGLFLCCAGLLIAQTPGRSPSQPALYKTSDQTPLLAQGKQLFQTNCSACHNFSQTGIGPNLAEIPTDISPAWVQRFIRNAPLLIEDGDKRANQLYRQYKLMMPAFTQLSDTEVEALTQYIGANRRQSTALAEDKTLGAAISDPVPQKIGSSGLRLMLDEITTAPITNAPPAVARINTMRVLRQGAQEQLFIADLQGILYRMQDKSLQTVLDLREQFAQFINKPGLGTGFGSFALHPLFTQNGLLYTTHTEKAKTAPADFTYADSIPVAMQWVVTEWAIENPSATFFRGKPRELMRIDMVSPIHGMQEIAFNPLATRGNPDFGNLYIGIGDGGATENGYYFLCNDSRKIWGKLLRINPLDRNSKNGRYGIPADNPYANDSSSMGEIYCRGFRNPNRFSWLPDGQLLVADIGQTNAEELNLAVKGADYGWPEREGTYRINHRAKMDKVYALPPTENPGTYRYPVAFFDHDEGNAISGGYVYSGKEIPLLRNKYVFGDVVSGRVFLVDDAQLKQGQQATITELDIRINGQPTSFKELNQGKKADLRIGEGPNGALYFFTKTNGKLYKVTACTPIP
ncbi:PQQ-dependent sugar dehydrogenase [Spirosoma spitsbergense]|uniref:PQQ-dependent sugar dehydrogenase n=1 Tax=Spirosoma spitsbergense TaxID=431554 RepID=UPI000360E416|nr:PQQ-dependent sugar dehydrogenase [Spirosoma spitsbergense]